MRKSRYCSVRGKSAAVSREQISCSWPLVSKVSAMAAGKENIDSAPKEGNNYINMPLCIKPAGPDS